MTTRDPREPQPRALPCSWQPRARLPPRISTPPLSRTGGSIRGMRTDDGGYLTLTPPTRKAPRHAHRDPGAGPRGRRRPAPVPRLAGPARPARTAPRKASGPPARDYARENRAARVTLRTVPRCTTWVVCGRSGQPRCHDGRPHTSCTPTPAERRRNVKCSRPRCGGSTCAARGVAAWRSRGGEMPLPEVWLIVCLFVGKSQKTLGAVQILNDASATGPRPAGHWGVPAGGGPGHLPGPATTGRARRRDGVPGGARSLESAFPG